MFYNIFHNLAQTVISSIYGSKLGQTAMTVAKGAAFEPKVYSQADRCQGSNMSRLQLCSSACRQGTLHRYMRWHDLHPKLDALLRFLDHRGALWLSLSRSAALGWRLAFESHWRGKMLCRISWNTRPVQSCRSSVSTICICCGPHPLEMRLLSRLMRCDLHLDPVCQSFR